MNSNSSNRSIDPRSTLKLHGPPPVLPLTPKASLTHPEPKPSATSPNAHKPRISLVNAAVFMRACKSDRAIGFQINSCPTVTTGFAMHTVDPSLEVPGLPEEYREYRDVFSAQRAKSLPEHWPHDLTIQIENDKAPPLGPVYFLSTLELQSLQEFLEENTKAGIICPSKAPCGTPVLFVKKKDRSLWLCVDYRGLNRITRKDHYPIPLLTDFLDAPRKARIYSKIDLKNAYHLVRIAKGDEWKTTFRTRYSSFEWLVMPFGLSNALSAF